MCPNVRVAASVKPFWRMGEIETVVSYFDFEYNPVLHRQVDKAHLP